MILAMRTFVYMPSLERISGGMAVIAQVAKSLQACGFDVALAVEGSLPAALAVGHLPIININELPLSPEDRWIVPEGWPRALRPALAAGAQAALYVQSWAFLHGLLPEGADWRSLGARMIAVSEPVGQFVAATTGLQAPIIRPAIDPGLFHPGAAPKAGKAPAIAWMPRKNKHLAKQIRAIFSARLALRGLPQPRWIEIDGLPPAKVAGLMRMAGIFLATGFPEGFGLPPLEAMACGCLVAGFAGMGAWDYMRQAIPSGWTPPISLPALPHGPNAFIAADGDVWGAAMALEAAYDALLTGEADKIRETAIATAQAYSPARQQAEALAVWNDEAFWHPL